MTEPEVILRIDDEVESFMDLKEVSDVEVENVEILEVLSITKYTDGTETVENMENILTDFGIHLIDSFVEIFMNDGILDYSMPPDNKRSFEKRKGVKYVLDQLKVISKEAKEKELWY